MPDEGDGRVARAGLDGDALALLGEVLVHSKNTSSAFCSAAARSMVEGVPRLTNTPSFQRTRTCSPLGPKFDFLTISSRRSLSVLPAAAVRAFEIEPRSRAVVPGGRAA